jgi:hypothetical protein
MITNLSLTLTCGFVDTSNPDNHGLTVSCAVFDTFPLPLRT